MSLFYELWLYHAKRRNYPTLNAFLTKNDPKGKAFQSTTKSMTGIPGKPRVESWAAALGLTKEETRDFIRAADYDRVLVAKDGEELGPGITMLMDRVMELEADLAKRAKEVASLRAQLSDIVAETKRIGLSPPDSCKDL